MPSSYAHYRFGGQMLMRLPESVKAAAEKFRKLYDLGTHGPDLFFYYRPLAHTQVAKLGKKYHFSPGKPLFQAAARRLRLQPREDAQAYLYGLLTHYALDSVCHPYVKQAQDGGIADHVEIETEFDRLLLQTDALILPKPRIPTGYMRLTRQESEMLAAFYPQATPRQLREAAGTMAFLIRKCSYKPGAKYRILKKALGSKFSQFLMTPQANPRCALTNEKLLALYGKAQDRFDILCASLYRNIRTGTPLGPEFAPAFDI